MKKRAVTEGAAMIDGDKRLVRVVAISAVVLCVGAIAAGTVSLLRVKAHQEAEVCLIEETGSHEVVHSVSAVLPAASIAAGLLALIRWRRSKNRRMVDIILAVAAVAVSIGVVIAYWVILSEFAGGHLH